MMRAVRITNTLTVNAAELGESFIPSSVYTQCVRWKRKPIWLPPGKSKRFFIPKKPVIPIEEKEQLMRLYNHYRTYMSSIRSYIAKVHLENSKIQFDEAAIKEMEEEDFQACSAINDKWNAEIVKQRELRLANMREESKEIIMQRLIEHEQEQTELRKKIDERVRKAKEDAPTFITAENVDAAIDECLANVIEHNRALDLEGNWHVGKYPPITATEEVQSSAAAEQ